MAEFDPAQSKLHLYDDTWELNDCCPCDLQFLEFLKDRKVRNATIFHMGTGAHHMVGLPIHHKWLCQCAMLHAVSWRIHRKNRRG